MDYTLEKLKQILKTRLQDQEFDDNTLTVFLNQAQDEILGEDKYPFMEQIDTYTAGDHGEISLVPGYAGTLYIYATDESQPRQPRQQLSYISAEEYFGHNGMPVNSYTIFANTLFYNVHKEKDVEGFRITHLYLENPRPLVKDTDRSPIPPQYIEALILGALARAEQMRDNFDYAQIYQNQQDQILTNMKLRYRPGPLGAENRAKLPFGGDYDGD